MSAQPRDEEVLIRRILKCGKLLLENIRPIRWASQTEHAMRHAEQFTR